MHHHMAQSCALALASQLVQASLTNSWRALSASYNNLQLGLFRFCIRTFTKLMFIHFMWMVRAAASSIRSNPDFRALL